MAYSLSMIIKFRWQGGIGFASRDLSSHQTIAFDGCVCPIHPASMTLTFDRDFNMWIRTSTSQCFCSAEISPGNSWPGALARHHCRQQHDKLATCGFANKRHLVSRRVKGFPACMAALSWMMASRAPGSIGSGLPKRDLSDYLSSCDVSCRETSDEFRFVHK
ncbi:hypothetical protein CORC01_11444 [Colletotrichum orchidophilum]|uniref:Uncharacterized protein n=1 Tax=Colletotrichum orchidophilum TaxID=1209926 RepID=A0A1G4AVL2_9PEZI|nr:uncharacterized protein CORC01_11444 [Colletotrichum orchidophilum]OHE93219.1 hypothetical protein CORC01_11444 [Colletotrichum orchidophilum]